MNFFHFGQIYLDSSSRISPNNPKNTKGGLAWIFMKGWIRGSIRIILWIERLIPKEILFPVGEQEHDRFPNERAVHRFIDLGSSTQNSTFFFLSWPSMKKGKSNILWSGSGYSFLSTGIFTTFTTGGALDSPCSLLQWSMKVVSSFMHHSESK